MKRVTQLLVLSVLLLGFVLSSNAQNFNKSEARNDASIWANMMDDPNANVYETKQAFNIYWSQRDLTKKEVTKGKGYKVFLRWQEFMKPRVFPNGSKFDNTMAAREFARFKKENPNKLKSASGSWTFLGPTKVTGTVSNGSYQSPGGAGRINCIAVNPSNSNNIFVGSPAGGLWQSTNGGTSWSTNTDNFSSLGISSIVFNPTTPTTMYIATGDGDAGDTWSTGVLKSTNGGSTWSATAIAPTVDLRWKIRKIAINPSNPNIMYVATSKGLLKTTDGFATYTTIFTDNCYDVELKPGTPTTVYAVGVTSAATKFYVSTDGTSFALAGTGLPSTGVQRVEIAVSAAAPNNVWALAGKSSDQGFYGFFTSTNSGTSFATTFNSTSSNHNLLGWNTNFSDAGGQAFYDLTLAVNPGNANEIFIGGVNLQKSTNGGTSWTCNGYWLQGASQQYTHADHHALVFLNSTTLYDGNDGGVFRTTNNGSTWTDISNNLGIAQTAAIGISQLNPNLIMTGMQDNGTNKWDGTTWKIVYGGDGCEAICDPINQSIVYGSYVYGDLYRSTNSGTSWSAIKPSTSESSAWITPFALHPTTNTTIYTGFTNMWRSTNSGSSYTKLGTTPGSGEIIAFKVAPSAPSTIYAIKEYWSGSAYVYTVAKTTNDGTAWTNLSSLLPLTTAAPTKVEVSPTDANKVWITFSSYAAGTKVYYSANGGTSFTNISSNLPNIPVNCVTYQKNTSDGIYIGTDAGVYYKDANMTNWVLFSTGLPNVIVKELEIYYDNTTPANSKLRAATYGRSVWESDLYSSGVVVAPTVTTTSVTSIANTTAATGGNVTSDGGGSVTARGVCYSTSTNPTTSNSVVAGGTGTGAFVSNLSGLNPGTTYYVRAYATNNAGTSYGSQVSFTTTNVVITAPTVTTTSISAITSSTATGGGNVTADGGATVTARGVCYSTTTNPTTSNSIVAGGTGTGSFSSSLTGLIAGTTYYVRAYATNSAGTSYGSQVSFTTIAGCSAVSSFPYNEGFDGTSVPSCWSNVYVSGTAGQIWQFGTFSGGISGATGNYAYLNSDGYGSGKSQNADLISPVFNFSSYSTVTLGFKDYFRSYSGSSGTLSYSTNGGTSWTSLRTWSATTSNPETVSINVSTQVAGYNNVKFKWNYTGTWGYYWSIDDISITATSTTVTPPTATTNAATGVGNTAATLNGSVNANNGSTTVTFEYGLTSSYGSSIAASPGTVTGSSATSVSAAISGLTTNTLYHYRVKAVNSAGTTYGTDATFTTTSTPLSYCTVKGNNVTYEWIDYVALNGMTRTSTADGGYILTTNNVSLRPGNSYTITFSTGYRSTVYTEYWRIWIDYNQNGTFETGELAVTGTSTSSANYTANFTVPSGATLGNTRMRVLMSDNSGTTSSCGTFTYGEVEDYPVTISTSAPVLNPSIAGGSERLSNINVENLEVYPNPANDLLNVKINFSNENQQVSLLSPNGVLVKKTNISNNLASFDVTDLAPGLYIIQVKNDKKVINKKFIKK